MPKRGRSIGRGVVPDKETRKRIITGRGLSDSEISAWVRKHRAAGFQGVFMADTVPQSLAPGQNFIVNLQASDKGGTHWVAFGRYRNGQRTDKQGQPIDYWYFDPLGVGYAPDALMAITEQSGPNQVLEVCNAQIQDIKSVDCGLFSAIFLLGISQGKKPRSLFKVFTKFPDHDDSIEQLYWGLD